MSLPADAYSLPQYAVLRVSGPDARAFLQGQLSCDLDSLTPTTLVLGSVNSPQGRAQAILWLVERTEGIAMIVGSGIAQDTLMRLKKYVLRSKVQIAIAGELACYAATLRPAQGGRHQEVEGVSEIAWPGARTLFIAPSRPADNADAARAWHLNDIRAGLPQIYPATRESFVAQMLNLGELGGISFEKGCYTGQEIIARAHFRGAVKRKMYPYSSTAPAPAPGTRVLRSGEHAGDVVDSETTTQGSEFLAVVSAEHHSAALELESAPGAALTLLR
jgi:folate-binding protein YgfZ